MSAPETAWDLDGLPPIQRTLAIPLVGRARAHQLFPSLGFSDPEAARLVGALRYSGTDALGQDRAAIWGTIQRTRTFDEIAREFLERHPAATVLNLGAGLCTRQSRVGGGRWIEADVAEVIDVRRRLWPADDRTVRIAADLSDPETVESLIDAALDKGPPGQPVLAIAEGVLMFLSPDAHRRVLERLSRRLPAGSRIVFDYLHRRVQQISRLQPASLKVTGARYGSALSPERDLVAFPRLEARELRAFTRRYPLALRALDRAVGLLLAGGASLYDVAVVDVSDRPKARSHGQVIAVTFAGFATGAALSARVESWWLYLPLQVFTAAFVLRAFCLVHELSHGSLLPDRRWNDLWGAVASVICALPYHPWKRVHIEHHKWAGHRGKDPTEDDIEFHQLKPVEQWLATVAWRAWLPLLGMSFSLRTFWNLPKLYRLFPSRRDRALCTASVIGIPLVHGALFALLGMDWVEAFVPALGMYLFVLDPLAISQHVGIPLLGPQADPRPLPKEAQESLARTLIFPRWVTRHLLLGFNHHALHHARPKLPGHLLDSIPFASTHEEHWWAWLKSAKSTPLRTLLTRDEHGA